PARGVSWRRGTNQVLVGDEHWRQGLLYDMRSRQVVREGLPWGMLWSPDGRFLAWNYANSSEDSPQAGVYELETGRQQHIRGHAFGWDPADGQLYWAGELAGE
ncbi:hypothetical protein, partial [Vitiosangium sp. GDMCC 1.1324]|uniref:hypothetical protein n=1 Tax=Vitiosangium sp. (strain GDMCC 1.1324) TaxID=2138576 RepID=UPI001E44B490